MQQIHNNGFFLIEKYEVVYYMCLSIHAFVCGFYLGYIIVNQY